MPGTGSPRRTSHAAAADSGSNTRPRRLGVNMTGYDDPAQKDVMSSLSEPTCRDLLSSSAERVRAGLVTVELEEAPCEHRNGT